FRNDLGCSGALLPPSPPAEQATARQYQAGKSSTNDGDGDGHKGRSSARTQSEVWVTVPITEIVTVLSATKCERGCGGLPKNDRQPGGPTMRKACCRTGLL